MESSYNRVTLTVVDEIDTRYEDEKTFTTFQAF